MSLVALSSLLVYALAMALNTPLARATLLTRRSLWRPSHLADENVRDSRQQRLVSKIHPNKHTNPARGSHEIAERDY